MTWRRLLSLAAVGIVAACGPGEPPARTSAADAAAGAVSRPREVAVARRHMVAAANPLAAEAGLDILRRGGGAIDAAIAMPMTLPLVEPPSSVITTADSAFLLGIAKLESRLIILLDLERVLTVEERAELSTVVTSESDE